VAQKMMVQLIDDLDGTQSEDIGTVTFGLDGVTYEIDLTEANAVNLRKSLAEFVTHARRTGGRVKRGTASSASNGSATANHEQAQAVREWARRNGHEVSNRGRIPASLIEAFEAAQAEASAKTRSRRRSKAAAS
jgi:Lsr2